MKTLAKRLQSVLKEGSLTVRDLSKWFDRPYPTVRTWVIGKEPWSVWREDVEEKLRALEALVSAGEHLPVPHSYTFKDRSELIQALIDERNAGLSRTRASARR